MLQLTFLFVGVVAVLATAATFSTRIDELTRLLTAVFAMATWAYWAVSAYGVEVVTDGGTRVTESYTGLVALGLVAAAVMLLAAVRLALGSAREAYQREAPEI